MLDPVEAAAIAALDDPLRGRLDELVRPSGTDVQVSIPARRYDVIGKLLVDSNLEAPEERVLRRRAAAPAARCAAGAARVTERSRRWASERTEIAARGAAEARGDDDPTMTDDELIDEASRGSFPASDPPSFWARDRTA